MSSDERELRRAWQRHVAPGADDRFESLVARHREPGRHYHDLRHVRWVVRHARTLAGGVGLTTDGLDEVIAAAFFHDAVYDATRSDNEAASARLATSVLTELGWEPARVARVAEMIAATAGHTDGADDPATAVLVAADLGVLAAEPARYSEYAMAVRREYGHLDESTWRSGRTAFIGSMLARESIFPPALHLDTWERRARANLTAELAAIG